MEEYRGKIKYYEDEIEVFFPIDFNLFKKKLSEMLGLTEDFLINVKLEYKDKENKNKFEIKNLDDYKIFFRNLKESKDLVILEIEIKDESDQDKKKLSESINMFKSNNSFNILNDNPPINNNIINNNNLGNIDNNISYDINNINQKNKINVNNSLNNNGNQRREMPNNIKNQMPFLMCSFPCSYCNISPIFNIIYYCPICNDIFCSNCELRKGPNHSHSYCKIQNKNQYNYFHLDEKINAQNLKNKFENKVKGVYNTVSKYLNNEPNLNNNYLVKKARSSYELKNISDEQIIDALRKTNGNIDDAVILLTLNEK